MAELADQPATVALDRLGPAREPPEVALVVDAHQDRRAGAGRVDVHELGHDHRGAALGAGRVIGDEAVGHGAVLAETGDGGGVDDAVAQFAAAHRDGAEQGIEGHGRVRREGSGLGLGFRLRYCRVGRVLRPGEAPGADVGSIVPHGTGEPVAERRVTLDEAGREGAGEPHDVLGDKDLTVAGRGRADPDGGHRELLCERTREQLDRVLDHDAEGACGFDRPRVGEDAPRALFGLALNLEAGPR